jgi:hypothetical protein
MSLSPLQVAFQPRTGASPSASKESPNFSNEIGRANLYVEMRPLTAIVL